MGENEKRSGLTTALLAAGLLLLGAAFLMRGNNWLVTPPVLGVQLPIAAGIGAAGIALCVASILIRRYRQRGR